LFVGNITSKVEISTTRLCCDISGIVNLVGRDGINRRRDDPRAYRGGLQ